MSRFSSRPLMPCDVSSVRTLLSQQSTDAGWRWSDQKSSAEAEEWIRAAHPLVHRLVVLDQTDTPRGLLLLRQMSPVRMRHVAVLEWAVDETQQQAARRAMAEHIVQSAVALARDWLNVGRIEIAMVGEDVEMTRAITAAGFQREAVELGSVFDRGEQRSRVWWAWTSADLQSARCPKAPIGPSDAQPPATSKISMPLVVRSAREEDIASLLLIRQQPEFCLGTLQLPTREFVDLAGTIRKRDPGIFRWLAELEGRIVGEIGLVLDQAAARRHTAQVWLGVHRDYWGHGIAKAMLRRALDEADNQLDLTRVELGVFSHNPVARRLYERNGFVVEGIKSRQVFAQGSYGDNVLMARVRRG